MNYAEFLRHKVARVVKLAGVGLIPCDRERLVPRYERIIEQLVRERSSTRVWKDIEHDLNVMIRATVGPKERKLMNDELIEKFGRTDIGSSDETIAKRVLKRGSIVGNEGQA